MPRKRSRKRSRKMRTRRRGGDVNDNDENLAIERAARARRMAAMPTEAERINRQFRPIPLQLPYDEQGRNMPAAAVLPRGLTQLQRVELLLRQAADIAATIPEPAAAAAAVEDDDPYGLYTGEE